VVSDLRGRVDTATARGSGLLRLLLPLRVPGVPVMPRALALVALRHPWVIPPLIRWRTASRGLGLVVARLTTSEQAAGVALQAIGEDQGRSLSEQLGYGRDLVEVARAVALANRLYDIRARVQIVSDEEVWVVTPGCPWSRETWWGSAPCGAFSRYEVGLAGGLNPRVRLRYLHKRTRGDSRCVGVYTWRGGEGAGSAADGGSVADDDVENRGDDRDQHGGDYRPEESGDVETVHQPIQDLQDHRVDHEGEQS
jgi:hypothetical protein